MLYHSLKVSKVSGVGSAFEMSVNTEPNSHLAFHKDLNFHLKMMY